MNSRWPSASAIKDFKRDRQFAVESAPKAPLGVGTGLAGLCAEVKRSFKAVNQLGNSATSVMSNDKW